MKFVKNLNRTALAVAAAITLGLSASACSSTPATVPDGDYLGTAVYGSDEGNGYVHLAVTVEAGVVTGSAEIYDFPASPCSSSVKVPCSATASVPDGDTSAAITGTVDGTTLNIVLTGADASVIATLEDDGTLTSDLIPDDPAANFVSYGMIYPDNGSETAFVCGGFGFGLTPAADPTSTDGSLAAFVTEDGNVFGILASDEFTGTLSATYEGGSGDVCAGSSTCYAGLSGTVSGTFNGDPVSFDIVTAASGLDFTTNADFPGDFTYAGFESDMENATQDGGFGGSTTNCTGAP